MEKSYFLLQYKLFSRHLSAFGVFPLLGYLLISILFIVGSHLLFYKTQYASYIYAFIAFSFLTLLNESNRNYFLKTCFSQNIYFKIRILENLLLVLPFLLFLIYQGAFKMALLLLVASFILATFRFEQQWQYALPTPFFKYPFEFIIGFRKTFIAIGFVYFLMFMAISVSNFNLGLFSLILLFFIIISFYNNAEGIFHTWIFALTPTPFLLKKILISFWYSSLLCLPILLGFMIFFKQNLWIVFIIQSLGYLYLMTMILAKYASFPHKINFPHTLLYVLGVWFPPILLATIPFFYNKATKQLKQILV